MINYLLYTPAICLSFLHGVWIGKVLPMSNIRLSDAKVKEAHETKRAVFLVLCLFAIVHDGISIMVYKNVSGYSHLFGAAFEAIISLLGAWAIGAELTYRSFSQITQLLMHELAALFMIRVFLSIIASLLVYALESVI